MPLHRFGDVTVTGVPFFVMDPAGRRTGTNLIALKGGPGTGNAVRRVPAARRDSDDGDGREPALPRRRRRVGVAGRRRRGTRQAGDEGRSCSSPTARPRSTCSRTASTFADALVRADVPLSSDAGDFTGRGQLRYFALNLGKKAPLSKIVLESYDGDVVPVTVAITAGNEPVAAPRHRRAQRGWREAARRRRHRPKEGGKGDAPLPETKPIAWAPGKAKVLVIGGGSSHNFGKFFGGTDVATLAAAGFSVNYTEDRDQAAAELANADVAVISVNRQFFDTPEYRKALFDFAAAGKGLVMLHPGTWYGYAQWPELNATIVGGGARGHDRIAKFSVNAVKPEHPVMKGVPASFDVEDELYYMNAEPDKIPAGHAADRSAGRNVAERALQAAAPGGLDHQASDGANRRHHPRPRRARARSRGVQDAARQCRHLGGRIQAVTGAPHT